MEKDTDFTAEHAEIAEKEQHVGNVQSGFVIVLSPVSLGGLGGNISSPLVTD
jgi:hypothetical protein